MNSLRFQTLETPRALLVLVFMVVSPWYLIWRLSTFNSEALFFSYLLYGAEVFGFCTACLHIFMTWRLTSREPGHAPNGLSVDVFIPTYNEPVELLRRTLLAARQMSYSHQTWLLDDGNRPEMRALAEEIGCRYLAREENTDAKAGNLNHALMHSRADFVAIFDADHAPHKDFLMRTLGYFQDQRVAFVQTPQDFYNLDSYQHRRSGRNAIIWTEQSLFFRVIQRGKDYWNAAFFCGSCAVVRRKALDSIGGFATGTVTEDLHTSIRLHAKGYRSVYHSQSLAFGLAPSNAPAFLRQRVRWGQGAMQVWRKEGILLRSGLTLAQRLNYFASVLTYFDGWQKAVFYIAPALVLMSGVMPIIASGPEFLVHFVPYYLLTFWVFEEVGRGYGRTLFIEQYNMARFAAFAWATLGFMRSTLKFRVTAKALTSAHGYGHFVLPQLLVMLFNTIAIPLGMVLYFVDKGPPADGLVANAIWAGINAALAAAVMAFTRKQAANQRLDYRFPVPLPGKIRLPDARRVFGTMDEISSGGFRFYAALPSSIVIGTMLETEIFLPSGPVGVQAEVRSLIRDERSPDHYIKAIGCSFEPLSASDRDQLDLFLYGSDLQLRLLQLREFISTPLERLAQLWSGRRRVGGSDPAHWAAMFYSVSGVSGKQIGFGLVSVPKDPAEQRMALLSKPMDDGAQLNMRLFTRTGQTFLHAPATLKERIESPVSPIHLYGLDDTMAESSLQEGQEDLTQAVDWDELANSKALAKV
jgi:cellulose synthase (UDP-forming)